MKSAQEARADKPDVPQNISSPTHGIHATWRYNRYGLVRYRISITFEDPQGLSCLYAVLCDGLAPATVDERHELFIVGAALWGLQDVVGATLLALGSGPIDLRALFLELKQHVASLSPEEQAIFRVGNDARRRFEALQARRHSAGGKGSENAMAPSGAAPRPRQLELDLGAPARGNGADGRREPHRRGAVAHHARRRPDGRPGGQALVEGAILRNEPNFYRPA